MDQSALGMVLAGFTAFDFLFMTCASLIAALAMRHWSQLLGAALIAYGFDVILRFAMELLSAGDMPANFAVELAFARMDMHGLAATARPFLYFGAIAILFAVKRRYAR
ncbi:MAG: hypothetical protein ACFE0P_11505 [Oceanicaulis sp.]